MAQITIVAPTAMEADSLASACLVLGLNETKKLLKSKNEVHAYLLDNNNNNVILHQIAGGP
jgi:thiamine biosynthesis lipoprotein ApbE